MSSSLHRLRRAALPRPVMTPVRNPAVTASVRPWPSWASNVLHSRAEPSECDSNVTLPSVSVPSTSISTTRICFARFASFSGIFFPRLANAFSLFSCVFFCAPRVSRPDLVMSCTDWCKSAHDAAGASPAPTPSYMPAVSWESSSNAIRQLTNASVKPSRFPQGLTPNDGSEKSPRIKVLRDNLQHKTLHQLQRPQIVQMHHPQHALGLIHHHNRRNLSFFHQVQGFAGQYVRPYRVRILGHAVRRAHLEDCSAVLLHQAPQVSVRQNSGQAAVCFEHRGHAQLLR